MLAVVLLGLLVATHAVAPRPINRQVRLERAGSAPFDAEVFYEMLPALAGPVEAVGVTPYERLADSALVGTTYVILTRTYTPDAAEAGRLLRYVARGNTLVVAAHVMGGPLGEALGTSRVAADGRRGLRTLWADEWPGLARGTLDRGDTLQLVSPSVAGAYGFPVTVVTSTLEGVDSSQAAVRGVAPAGGGRPTKGEAGPHADPVLVTTAWGRGRVVVSSTPLAFSNAALTGPGDAAAFVAAVFADVPRGPVLWDDSTKPYRSHAQTPLRFVLGTPSLRWAYGLLMATGLLYVFFRGRRWQRAIPEVPPPPNAQREFARTVGHLHWASGDTRALARLKARTVLDRLERELRLPEPALTDETARRAAAHAGIAPDDVLDLFARLRHLADHPGTSTEWIALDQQIESFFARAAAA